MTHLLLLIMLFSILMPVSTSSAASIDSVIGTLSSATAPADSNGSNFFEKLFDLVFKQILGPIFNVFSGDKSDTNPANSPVKVTPLPPTNNSGQNHGSLQGKVIIIDPGHGGSNPGAVGFNTRESDNNLAVGLKLRDKLSNAGAKVIMTRTTDRTVAPEGSTLGQELQARVDIAEKNNADIFVSVHTNSNPDTNIVGATTFYPQGKPDGLAREVQTALINNTQAVNKGVEPATFYVLRNTSMPSILVEMGFNSNRDEASRLQDDSYRNQIASGIYDGIASYFN